METLQRTIEPYRHLDPIGWVGVYRTIPLWAGVLCVVLGAVMCAVGGGRLFRLVAAPLGAAIGFIWVSALAGRLGFAGLQQQIGVGAAGVLFVAGLLVPPEVMFFAFGVPLGMIGGQIAGTTDWLLGFSPGFIIGGALGVALHRIVGALLSSLLGAWALVLGVMATLGPVVSAVGWLANNPVVALSVMGFIAVVSSVYQIVVRPSPEQAAKLKRERDQKKQRDSEKKALEHRWANYTKNSTKQPRD